MNEQPQLYNLLSPLSIPGKKDISFYAEKMEVKERLELGRAMADAGYNVAVLKPLPVPPEIAYDWNFGSYNGPFGSVATDEYDRFADLAVQNIPGCRVLEMVVPGERYVEWARDIAVYMGGEIVFLNAGFKENGGHLMVSALNRALPPGYDVGYSFLGEGGRTIWDGNTIFVCNEGKKAASRRARITGHSQVIGIPPEGSFDDTDHIDLFFNVIPSPATATGERPSGRLIIADSVVAKTGFMQNLFKEEKRRGNEVAVTQRQPILVPNLILPMPDGRVMIPDRNLDIRPQIEGFVGRTNVIPIDVEPNPMANIFKGGWRCSFTTLPLDKKAFK